MANKQFTIVGPFRAYDTDVGKTVALDPADPGVQANLAAGVIMLTKGGKDDKPPVVPCPACTEQGEKTPPAFSTQSELDDHYRELHPALVAPSLKEGEPA